LSTPSERGWVFVQAPVFLCRSWLMCKAETV
jgi:hypothetical protein